MDVAMCHHMPMKDVVSGPSRDTVAPQPIVSYDGLTLAATMQLIKEKLSQQGQFSWTETQSNLPGVTYRISDTIADVKTDLATCTLITTETVDSMVDISIGSTLNVGGKLVTADEMRSHIVETDTTPLKQVEKIIVEKVQDSRNKVYATAGHPEISVMVTPPVFYVMLSASSAVISGHTATTKGNQAKVEKDKTFKTNGLAFRDEETANRVAKAMTHAMELCGGGVSK